MYVCVILIQLLHFRNLSAKFIFYQNKLKEKLFVTYGCSCMIFMQARLSL